MNHLFFINAVTQLAHDLGYKDKPSQNLLNALTHRTFVHESKELLIDNQRLEFLGDAVVGLIVANELMKADPDRSEGQLSAARAHLINAKMLAQCADEQGLDPLLRIGKGEINMGEAARVTRLADAFEAVTGALFLDYGLSKAQEWVWGALRSHYNQLDQKSSLLSSKTRLQEWTHQHLKQTPIYQHTALTSEEGDGFLATVVGTESVIWGRGEGKSKKEAERRAAEHVLRQIESGDLSLMDSHPFDLLSTQPIQLQANSRPTPPSKPQTQPQKRDPKRNHQKRQKKGRKKDHKKYDHKKYDHKTNKGSFSDGFRPLKRTRTQNTILSSVPTTETNTSLREESPTYLKPPKHSK